MGCSLIVKLNNVYSLIRKICAYHIGFKPGNAIIKLWTIYATYKIYTICQHISATG
jgi:hypothetical protein